MLTLRLFWAFLLLWIPSGAHLPVSAFSAQPYSSQTDTLTLCFVSDTQEPMTFERMFLAYNRNAFARKLIFEKIQELHPTSVIHLGDEISSGSGDDNWKEIDEFVKGLREQGVQFQPIPGNHEYLFSSKKGIANFISRYPDAPLTGYTRRYGNVAVVLVNSNIGELSEVEADLQVRSYRQTLSECESDPLIDFVIVGCHHSPYTNSKIVSASKEVQDYFLPDFVKSKKCRLFVSGHAHAFEHFRVNDKDFFVIGGGGGLQHPLKVGKNSRYQDLFSNSLEKRMFHFLTVKSYADTLTVEAKIIRSDFKGFESIPQLKLSRDRSEN